MFSFSPPSQLSRDADEQEAGREAREYYVCDETDGDVGIDARARELTGSEDRKPDCAEETPESGQDGPHGQMET